MGISQILHYEVTYMGYLCDHERNLVILLTGTRIFIVGMIGAHILTCVGDNVYNGQAVIG